MPSLFDELKGGLGALLDRVAGEEDGPIRELTPRQLREELDARAKLRTGAQASASPTHPIARRADSSAAARKAREAMAKEREARVRGARKKREDAARRAQDAAFEEAKRRAADQARRAAASGRSASSSSRARPGGRSSGSTGPSFGRDKVIAEHYKTLDLPYGADFPTVKSQFRKLMRKYHPDLHSGTAKQKAAAELSTKFNVAYNALEDHLKGK